jgi:type VI secretion system protein ImpA
VADIELSKLVEPLSAADPCGPDLELADDDDYLNAIVTIETVLPPEYFVFSDYIGSRQPFDQDRRYADLDIGTHIKALGELIERTHDIRLDTLLAKLFVLAKDLAGAEACVSAIAVLLDTYWDDVHPRVEDGDEVLRREVLQRLDDTLLVTALQHVPLFVSKRHGAITWHKYTAELRKTGANLEDTTDFDRSLAEEGQTELSAILPMRDELARVRQRLTAFVQALARIRAVCADRMREGPPGFPALQHLVGQLNRFVEKIFRLVEGSVVRLDPSASIEPSAGPASAEAPEPAPGDGVIATVQVARPRTGLGSVAEARAALAAATDYFERHEPSNPGLLLLKQAQSLIGKSFFQAMQVLLPDHAAKAMLEVGSAKTFALPVARLAEMDATAEPSAASDALDRPSAETREEAVSLLEQVGAYFRRFEPSSPIPMLTDGARGLAGKDFMTLLADVLPKDVLKAPGAK